MVTKSSIIVHRNHRWRSNFSIRLENGLFQNVENLKSFSCFVFEIFNKILLSALGIWLSILIFIEAYARSSRLRPKL